MIHGTDGPNRLHVPKMNLVHFSKPYKSFDLDFMVFRAYDF